MKTDSRTLLQKVNHRLEGAVAVLAGGTSAEREISLQTGRAVLAALQRQGVDSALVDTRDEDWLTQVQERCAPRYGLAFIALHGPGGEDGTVQGALASVGTPFTGSGVLGSALAMDKQRSKLLWKGMGLPTPAFMLLSESSDWDAAFATLGECIVKPNREGSSIGMARVSDAGELAAAFAAARPYGEVFAEQWIVGEEYTVAIVGDEALPAIRLETDHRFYDFEAKYQSESTRYICPCGLGYEDLRVLNELSLKAFNSLGCSGWGRVDVMRDARGAFQLLEVNTIPGMTDHSLVPMAARARGWSFDELVLAITAQGLEAAPATREASA